MPEATEAARGPILLERDGELATVAVLVDAARRGDGRLLVIEGTAGIGKTRLLAEARAHAGDEMRVLSARAGEFEGDFAFGVVRQLFEPLLAAAPAEVRTELLSGAGALAAPLFDATSLVERPDGEGDTSFAMLHGLYWLAANVAFEAPTLLAIDDLHWADTPSLRWLCYLVHRLEGLPLLVAGTMRPPEQGRDPELLAELLADPAGTAIRPGPLTVNAIAELARQRFDEDVDRDFCAAVAAATRGNPLFVLALLDTVAREGIRPLADQAHVLLELGPRVVGRAVSLRLARLPDEARALLEAAAILGDGTPLAHVGAVAGLDRPAGSRAARALVGVDLLARDEPVEFVHPVVRTAIYEGLDPAARSDAHRRAAGVLLEAGAPPEQAAAHLVATVPGSDAFVVATLREAAARSLGRGAPDAAAGYLTRALREGLDAAARAEVLVELGLAKRLTDGSAAAEHLLEGLALLEDSGRRAEVALELGALFFYLNRLPEAIDALRRTLEGTSYDEHPDLHERLEAELISAAGWAPETLPLAKERLAGLALERLHGGPGSDQLLADAAFWQSRLGDGREIATALARRALTSGSLVAIGDLGLHFAAFSLATAGHHDEALAVYDVALDAARRRGDVFRAAPILAFRGNTKTLRGDLDAARADLRAGVDLSFAQGVQTAVPYAVGFLALGLIERGAHREAAEAIARVGLPEAEALPVVGHFFFLQLARARLRVETGDVARGVDELLELGRRAQLIVFDNPAMYPWRVHAAEGLLRLGRTDEARELAEANVVVCRRWGVAWTVGAAVRTLGLARGGSEGDELLRHAAGLLAQGGARHQHARALVELGSALRRHNQRAEARDVLREGSELAQRAGALGLARRANDELAATGARPRKIVVAGLDALTASERRVAELAARDRSNKEIAQELFVTVKTVELHLSSVYRKLGIGSRRQLAAALADGQPAPVTAG